MQIPCEYDQLLVSNKYDTRRGGVKFEATRWSQHDPFSGREVDLNPGPPEYKSRALPLGPGLPRCHARLSSSCTKIYIGLRLSKPI